VDIGGLGTGVADESLATPGVVSDVPEVVGFNEVKVNIPGELGCEGGRELLTLLLPPGTNGDG